MADRRTFPRNPLAMIFYIETTTRSLRAVNIKLA